MKELYILREVSQALIHASTSRVTQRWAFIRFWKIVQSVSGKCNGCVLIQSEPKTSAAYPVLVKVSEAGQAAIRARADCLE